MGTQPRRRHFFNTWPVGSLRVLPPRRPPPWDRGFALRWDGGTAVMMRPRGDPGEVLASPYQYHPRFLLYANGSPWHLGDLDSVGRRIQALMPEGLREGFRLILSGRDRAEPAAALRAARWLQHFGAGHGLRTPTAVERARATGQGA